MNPSKHVFTSRKNNSSIPWWAWTGAPLLVLLAIFSIWQSNRAQRQLADLQSRLNADEASRRKLEEEKSSTERVRAIVTDSASLRFRLRSKSLPSLKAFWHPTLGILIYGTKIPFPAAGHAFQVWFIPKEKNASPLHSNAFVPDSAGIVTAVMPVDAGLRSQTTALAISEEPIEGAARLPAAPIWLGTVPR